MENHAMRDKSEELLFSFLSLNVSASGRVAFIVASAVSILIVAIAWRVAKSR
jgi:hypothetical protein